MTNPINPLRVAVIGGDGTGPEVVAEAVKVLKAVAQLEGIQLELREFDLGGERYLRTGEVLPEDVFQELKTFPAILLGAIGHPDVPPGILERGLLLQLRFRFDQYINLRPGQALSRGRNAACRQGSRTTSTLSWCARTTEDLYCRLSAASSRRERRTRSRSRRPCTPARVASGASAGRFEYTRRRRNNPKGKRLTLVAKTNVLTYGHDLWWRTFREVAREFPDVQADYNHVDACCMWMVKNPEYYDVIVTTNMFGDIITDLAAIIQGGMGVAAGANINPGSGRHQHVRADGRQRSQVHRQRHVINPIAAIGSRMAMLLEHTGQRAAQPTGS
ncbi:MAG: 3-isopropylmalate dehydrogenase [Thermogutta sp.]|nr:MAG: 3-isopropylmalate dehydrogenase [Thermogutta sp.]